MRGSGARQVGRAALVVAALAGSVVAVVRSWPAYPGYRRFVSAPLEDGSRFTHPSSTEAPAFKDV